ncbi:hypothetical protein [Aureimonas sp. AU20]|uniref:hypothetical protein n=1 Tax=Aureimonas sp. AU20 TaxID=1349819 RepID=UPI000722B5E8|nr:hypothetical protein [Aureimonas sp. AU20]ALN75247.1 hypothetical protein M673_21165 [Aureimonas sp. AU20]
MSALREWESAFDPLAFTLRPNGRGCWLVEGPCNRCGGLFVSRDAALAFIRRERRALEETLRSASARSRSDPDTPPTSTLPLRLLSPPSRV